MENMKEILRDMEAKITHFNICFILLFKAPAVINRENVREAEYKMSQILN